MKGHFGHLVFIFLFSAQAVAEEQEVIEIAAIDWCPQLCPAHTNPGYITELVEQIYGSTNYHLNIKTYPWSRALSMVRKGEVDAVLSPARAEAPDLMYPHYEVGVQRMCFFTLASNSWEYDGVSSLAGLQFGVASDTSLEELNDYTALNPQQFQFQPYHERYILQQAEKLKRGRIDAFLFTYNSTRYTLQQADQWSGFRSAGCVSNAKVYMAFTPSEGLQAKIRQMMDAFDQGMKQLEREAKPPLIMQRYGLEYWK
tara:strand:+ start:607 stop:1374 length:768 start_codon:yes stop_codon:yes gene_type:complete